MLLHGWMGTSHVWLGVAEQLQDQFQLVIPDMRGYGESDKPYAGYDGATLADDLLGILDALGIPNAAVIGHDMGAIPALLFAAKYPHRTTFLGYVDEPLPGYNLQEFTAFDENNVFPYWWFSFNSQAHLPALMWEGKEAQLVDYFVSAMTADPHAIPPDSRAEIVRTLRKPGGLHGSFGWYREALRSGGQIREATRSKLQLPVLAVNGQYGHPGVGDQMRLVASEVTSFTVANCGHLVPEERPDEFADILRDFANAHAGGQP
ncbi:MAG: alpha/beta hydrolase [Fimbriimonadaceae bacterium]|nr:alpha/beta hydrolase [Fimbriimonadaceae bacterium]